MAHKTRWDKVGNTYYLRSEYCYPGSIVSIEPSGYRRYRVGLHLRKDARAQAEAKGLKPKPIISKREWALASAKKHGNRIAHDLKWLRDAGIVATEQTQE